MKMIPDIIAECIASSPEFQKYFESIISEYEKISIEIKENPYRNRCRKVCKGVYKIEVNGRTPYLVAHELEHCLIFESDFPEVQVNRDFFSMMLSQSKGDVLEKLLKIVTNINSFAYDPLIDNTLESFGFNIQSIHSFLLTVRPPIEHFEAQDRLSRKASILYFSLKRYLLEKYYQTDECPFVEVYCQFPDIAEKSIELIDILKRCRYESPLEIKCLFIDVIKCLELEHEIQDNIIYISLPNW